MQNLHYGLIMLLMLLSPVNTAKAQVNIGIGLPNVSIGINLPLFPHMVPVPGYPVYYAPSLDANYFFYDGMYWVYQGNDWYASSWYNGPWGFVRPEAVPLFILRIPVRYYQQPPEYFRGWQSNAPPRWGQQWGHEWEQRRNGWDRWNRRSVPARAPLPAYQRRYTGDSYPRIEQQHILRNQSYRYQPRDKVVREHLKPAPEQKAPPAIRPNPPENQLKVPPRQAAPPVQQQRAPALPPKPPVAQQKPPAAPQKPPVAQQKPPAVPQKPPVVQQKPPAVPQNPPVPTQQPPSDAQHQPPAAQQEPRQPQEHDRGASQDPRRDQGRGQKKDEEHGRGR